MSNPNPLQLLLTLEVIEQAMKESHRMWSASRTYMQMPEQIRPTAAMMLARVIRVPAEEAARRLEAIGTMPTFIATSTAGDLLVADYNFPGTEAMEDGSPRIWREVRVPTSMRHIVREAMLDLTRAIEEVEGRQMDAADKRADGDSGASATVTNIMERIRKNVH